MNSRSTIIAAPIAHAATNVPHTDHCGTKDAVLGATFASTLDTPDAVAVHCSPHAYPLGQQLPPRSAGQLYHALGHDPPSAAPAVATPAPDGATTVTPFVAMTVVEDGSTQDPVVWQSRPTLQQPDG
ncbi:hypothetical protein OPT61_g6175 [Boeremia exigua]|uniref:Uncharacterized protein n=1 Tax=Boeremia exigua TaxID=749465 RepID=A0ACC2I7Y4_9PLEO|nr:hypothetical protein OPT61_g6175 [Boeremia exigua]